VFSEFHVRQPGSLPQLAADGQRNYLSHESHVPHDGHCSQVATGNILFSGNGADGIEGLAGEKSAFNASVKQSERGNAARFVGLFEAKAPGASIHRIEGLRGEDQ
jgi:hypothetical protein